MEQTRSKGACKNTQTFENTATLHRKEKKALPHKCSGTYLVIYVRNDGDPSHKKINYKGLTG